MEYLNIPNSFGRSPQFIGSDPVQRGTWIALLSYCCELENGGIIENCASWNTRKWEQSCGVTRREVQKSCDLWSWNGDAIHVWGYPHNMEARIKGGRAGGHLGGRPKKGNPAQNPPDNPPGNPSVTLHETILEPKEGRKEGKEGREGTHAREAPVSVDEAQGYATSYSQANSEMLVIEPAWVAAWFDHREAGGWIVVRNGVEIPIADWRADLRSWCRNEKIRLTSSPPRSQGGQKKENGGGGPAPHPLALPPGREWKKIAARLCARFGWDEAALPETNWDDLRSEEKQAVHDEHRRAGGQA